MADLYLIFSHALTEKQKVEARNLFSINNFFYLPEPLQKIWSEISPHPAFPEELNQIITWLNQNSTSGDYVLVQGEYGATFYLVGYCFKNNLVPIYATSERVYEEKKLDNGDIIRQHTFRHVRFRKYRRFEHE